MSAASRANCKLKSPINASSRRLVCHCLCFRSLRREGLEKLTTAPESFSTDWRRNTDSQTATLGRRLLACSWRESFDRTSCTNRCKTPLNIASSTASRLPSALFRARIYHSNTFSRAWQSSHQQRRRGARRRWGKCGGCCGGCRCCEYVTGVDDKSGREHINCL